MPEQRLTIEQTHAMLNDIASKVGILNDRLRLIEERTHQNTEKIRVLDDNLITKVRDIKDDTKRLTIEVDDIRKTLDDVVKSLQRLIKDVANSAKLSDVNVIEKVLDFFDPTRYLTEKDVIRLIEERGSRE